MRNEAGMEIRIIYKDDRRKHVGDIKDWDAVPEKCSGRGLNARPALD
jgi:predicted phosphatase